jgi:hypothetical protein
LMWPCFSLSTTQSFTIHSKRERINEKKNIILFKII